MWKGSALEGTLEPSWERRPRKAGKPGLGVQSGRSLALYLGELVATGSFGCLMKTIVRIGYTFPEFPPAFLWLLFVY